MDRLNNLLEDEQYQELMKQIEINEQNRIYCCHGFEHCLNVARIAYIISLEENINVDKEIIYMTAALHDIGRAKNHTAGINHHELSAKYAAEILEKCHMKKEEIELICSAILSHNTDGGERTGLAFVIYKADKISRNCFMCKAKETCYWKEWEKNKEIQI